MIYGVVDMVLSRRNATSFLLTKAKRRLKYAFTSFGLRRVFKQFLVKQLGTYYRGIDDDSRIADVF